MNRSRSQSIELQVGRLDIGVSEGSEILFGEGFGNQQSRLLIATNEAGVVIASGIGLGGQKVSARSNNASLESVDSANLNVDKVRRVILIVPDLRDLTSGVLSKVHIITQWFVVSGSQRSSRNLS